MKKTYSVPVVKSVTIVIHKMMESSPMQIEVSKTTTVTADMADVKEESGNGIWD